MASEFVTSTPPTIHLNSRVLGICGVPPKHSSPKEDGHFHSDFYLYHHLLQDIQSQTWLTSISPSSLLTLSQKYTHQSSSSTHRAVLSPSLLPQIAKPDNIQVIDSKDLLPTFLSTLKTELKMAKSQNQNLVVLIFGHGDIDAFGIGIGEGEMKHGPRFRTKDLEGLLFEDEEEGVDVKVVMNSCFTDQRWVIKDYHHSHNSDMTSLANTGISNLKGGAEEDDDEASSARELAGKLMRGRGSNILIERALMCSLLVTMDTAPEAPGMFRALDYVMVSDDEGELIGDWDSFGGVFGAVREAMGRLVGDDGRIRFDRRGEDEEGKWKEAAIIGRERYIELWGGLEVVDVEDEAVVVSESEETTGNEEGDAINSDDESILAITPQVKNLFFEKSLAFMSTHPGNLCKGTNTILRQLNLLITDNRPIRGNEYKCLHHSIDYRYNAIKIATEYAKFLGLKIGDGMKVNVEWKLEKAVEIRKGGERDKFMKRWNKVRSLVLSAGIDESPLENQGYFDSKPVEYLDMAFLEEGWEMEEIKIALRRLKRLRSAVMMILADSEIAREVWKDEEVVRCKGVFYDEIGVMMAKRDAS